MPLLASYEQKSSRLWPIVTSSPMSRCHFRRREDGAKGAGRRRKARFLSLARPDHGQARDHREYGHEARGSSKQTSHGIFHPAARIPTMRALRGCDPVIPADRIIGAADPG